MANGSPLAPKPSTVQGGLLQGLELPAGSIVPAGALTPGAGASPVIAPGVPAPTQYKPQIAANTQYNLPSSAFPMPTGPVIKIGAQSYTPSLIDLANLASRYNPDEAVLGGFGGEETSVKGAIQGGRTEADRARDYGVQQVGRIAPMAQQIYGTALSELDRRAQAGAAANQAALGGAVPGLQFNTEGEVAAMRAAAQLAQGGFEAQAPLLSAGLGEIRQRQEFGLTNAEAEALREIGGRRTGYLADLAARRAEALGRGEEYNVRARTEAEQFAADQRARAEAANAEARMRAAERANEAALARYSDQQRQRERMEDREFTRSESALDRAARGGTADRTPQQQIQESLNFLFPDPNAGTITDPARGMALAQSGFKPYGKGVDAYNDVKKWIREGKTDEEIFSKLGKRAGNYSRAVSLALFEGRGVPGVTQSLSALGR